MPVEQTSSIDLPQLQSIQLRLAAINAQVALAEELLRSGKANELWVFRWPSCQVGLERLEAFSTELQRSTVAAISGNPFREDTQKGRRTKGSNEKKTGKKKA